MEEQISQEYQETVVEINRVSKKTKGGNQIRFSALVVVGDRKGKVAAGLGKAPSVTAAIKKAANYAKKHLILVPMRGTTVPFAIRVKYGAAEVLVKPAAEGTGVVAGGPLRVVFEAAGIKDIVAKMLGSNNKITNVYAAIKALKEIRELVEKRQR
jgi:small subunit ribosomal protein S5